MDWLESLFMGSGIAHTMLVLSLVITGGIMLSKIKIGGISIGVTWILFVGIVAGHFGMTVDENTLHFIKEFGLILFVFSIGLQVGPGFFSSFKEGGLKMVACAASVVALGAVATYVIHLVTGTPMTTMVGVMSGAVTNTPGLGAAQQAYADLTGVNDPTIALGYAVAYPLGVVGVILSLVAIRFLTRVDFAEENKALEAMRAEQTNVVRFSVEFTNGALEGHTVAHLRELINRSFVISRIMHEDGEITIADATSRLKLGEKLRVISSPEDQEAVLAFLGQQVEMSKEEWGAGSDSHTQLVSRRIVITKPEINGKKFSDLRLRSRYGINITRVNRAGIDLIPYQGMELQMGDRVMVVGNETAIEQVADVLGNSMKKLREPQLLTIFLGIALGVLFGSMPLMNIPQPVKLGLAGGPLIVAILIGRFGPHYGLVTYTTMSANLMLREVGLAMFLAGVGIGAGEGFVEAIVDGGYRWIGYGFIITVLPVLIVGLFARLKLKMNFYTLMGLLAGSSTNPPALGYANSTAGNDMPALGYATVYPVVMFLRVLVAQMLILMVM
ncbi:MAG: putative transporter [Alistipes sp.]|nr:putative transporter [Rikenellaceae bacterium]MBQ4540998.1 putative transporter [Alistipes sp.]MDO5487319.1 putative transporter [Rikenellaceae bacterium]